MKTTACIVALLSLAAAGDAGLAEQQPPHSRGHCEIHCPRCQCCVPGVDVEKIKEHCWEVECEPFCIPHVTFPWERRHCQQPCGELGCPPAKCAKVRNIHVLKLVEYECQVCKYSWQPRCAPPCGCSSPGGNCAQEFVPSLPVPPAPRLDLPPPSPSTKARQSTQHWKFGW